MAIISIFSIESEYRNKLAPIALYEGGLLGMVIGSITGARAGRTIGNFVGNKITKDKKYAEIALFLLCHSLVTFFEYRLLSTKNFGGKRPLSFSLR